MTGSDTASQIAYLARVLKAPALRESAERLAAAALDDGWTHQEYLVSAYELRCRRRYGQTCRGVERPDEHPAGHGQRARRAFTSATFKTEKRG